MAPDYSAEILWLLKHGLIDAEVNGDGDIVIHPTTRGQQAVEDGFIELEADVDEEEPA